MANALDTELLRTITKVWDNQFDGKSGESIKKLKKKLCEPDSEVYDKLFKHFRKIDSSIHAEAIKEAQDALNKEIAANKIASNDKQKHEQFKKEHYLNSVIPKLLLMKPKESVSLIQEGVIDSNDILTVFRAMLKHMGVEGEDSVNRFVTQLGQDMAYNNGLQQQNQTKSQIAQSFMKFIPQQHQDLPQVVIAFIELWIRYEMQKLNTDASYLSNIKEDLQNALKNHFNDKRNKDDETSESPGVSASSTRPSPTSS